MARVRVTEPVLDGSFAERLKADRNRRLIEGDPDERSAIERANKARRDGGGNMTPFRMAAAAQGLFCKSWSVPTASDPPSRYEARADGEAYRPRRG